MKYTAICLAAFAMAAQAIQLEAEACVCAIPDDDCPCKDDCVIKTCPDGSQRDANCECGDQDPVEPCDRNVPCWDGRPKDQWCMCPDAPVCPIEDCPDGTPRDDFCKCPNNPKPNPDDCSDKPCWDGSARDEWCMCPKPTDPCIWCPDYEPTSGNDGDKTPDDTSSGDTE